MLFYLFHIEINEDEGNWIEGIKEGKAWDLNDVLDW